MSLSLNSSADPLHLNEDSFSNTLFKNHQVKHQLYKGGQEQKILNMNQRQESSIDSPSLRLPSHKPQSSEPMHLTEPAQKLMVSKDSGRNVASFIASPGVIAQQQQSDKLKLTRQTKHGSLFSHFKVTNIISRFRRNMLSLVVSRRKRDMNENHLSALNDLADWSSAGAQSTSIFSHFKFIRRAVVLAENLLRETTIFPDSTFHIAWVSLIIVNLLYQYIVFPLKIAFGLQFVTENNSLFVIQGLSYFTLFADIGVNFFTAINLNGQLITEKKTIAQRYLRGYFWVDLGTNLSSILADFSQNSALEYVCVLRLAQLAKYWGLFKDHFHLLEKFNNQIQLFDLFMMVLITSHFWCCGFILMGRLSAHENNWIAYRQLDASNSTHVYLEAFYFAIISMITIGYGDVVPISSREKLYVIIMTIGSSANFGFIVNTIGQIFSDLAQKQAQLKKDRYIMLNYMKNRAFDAQLQLQVFRYIDFMSQKNDQDTFKAQDIINKLQPELKENLLQDYYGKIVLSIQLFVAHFSQEVRHKIAMRMEEHVFGPGELIFQQGIRDGKLFFVRSGSIDYLLDNQGVTKIVSAMDVTIPAAPPPPRGGERARFKKAQ